MALASPVTVSELPPETSWSSVSRVPSGRQNQKLFRAALSPVPRNEMELSSEVTLSSREPPQNAVPAGAGCTQGALVGCGGGRTRTVTVSARLSPTPSLTTSENTRSVRTEGAVNDGVAVSAPLRVTDTPAACVHL